MKRFRVLPPLLLAVVLLGTSTRAVFAQSDAKPNRGKSYAVLFGVGTFPSLSQFGDLLGAVNDMTALREGWFDAPEFEGRVYSLVEGAQGEKALEPTRANFEKALDEIASLTNDDDAIYVCVATHGVAALNRSFICPRDAIDADLSEANAENLDGLAQKKGLIAVASLLDRLEKTKGRKVLIIDACREKTPGDKESDFLREFEDRLRNKNKKSANLAVISSCCLGQLAGETQAGDGRFYGRFFSAFLEGLNGNAELTGSYDGEITLIEAYNYANQRTKRAAAESGQAQTPELYEANDASDPNGVDRLVLAKYDLFAQTPDAQTLAKESDALFAIRAGDVLTKSQKDLARGAKGDYPLVEDLFDYALEVQPGNRLARNLRGYARRAQANYAGALKDFNRIGAELVLFAKADPKAPAYSTLNACPVYDSSTATEYREKAYFSFGTLLVVDQVAHNRCRVVSWNSKPTRGETWVSVDAVGWSRIQAETMILGTENTPVRTELSSNGPYSQTPTPSYSPAGGNAMNVLNL